MSLILYQRDYHQLHNSPSCEHNVMYLVERLDCSQALALVSNSAAHASGRTSLSSSLIIFSIWNPRNGITKANGRSVFKVIDTCCRIAFLKNRANPCICWQVSLDIVLWAGLE